MAGFGVAAKARVSVVTDTPIAQIPPGIAQGPDWLDTSSASFWVLLWALILIGVVYAVVHGLIFG